MKSNLVSYVELSVAMVIVGSTVVVGKLVTLSFPVFLASALRFALSSLILLPLLLKAGNGFPRLSRKDVAILFVQAFAGNFLFTIFLLYGLKWTSATESGIILSTTPAVIGLISFFFLKEQLTWKGAAGATLAVLGVLMLTIVGASSRTEQGANPVLGNLLICAAVIGEALWTTLGKVGSKRIAPLTMANVMSLFGFLLFLPFALYEVRSVVIAAVPLLNWLFLLYYGLATVSAYILWYRGVSKVPANVAGVFTGVLPISAAVLSYIVLKEQPSWSNVLGVACVLLAIVLITRGSAESRKGKIL